MEIGTLMRKKDKSAVHEKMWALCIHRKATNQDEWFTFFGDLPKGCLETSDIRFDFEVNERNGKTYRNINNIEPAVSLGEQKSLAKDEVPEKIEEPIGQNNKETAPSDLVEIQVAIQGIERIETSVSEMSARLKSCENMLGSIIVSLPGIHSKNKR